MYRYVLSYTYVFPRIECIFTAKSFSLGNLFFLTNFQKLYAVSNIVSILYILLKDVMLVLIKITYCRDGQLI